MNAIQMLKQDHRDAMGMIEQIMNNSEGTASDRSNMDMFNQLKESVLLHAKMEEQVFYPALQNHDETRDQIKDSYQEHKEVEQLLGQMSGMAASNAEFMSKLTQLRDNIAHHVDEEENELFPKAEGLLGQSRLQEMGRQMMQMKQGRSATATVSRK